MFPVGLSNAASSAARTKGMSNCFTESRSYLFPNIKDSLAHQWIAYLAQWDGDGLYLYLGEEERGLHRLIPQLCVA